MIRETIIHSKSFGLLIEHNFEQAALPDFKLYRDKLHKFGFLIFRGFNLSSNVALEWFLSIGNPIDYSFGKVLVMEPKENTTESQFTNKGMMIHQDTILNKSIKANTLCFYCEKAPQSKTGATLLVDNRIFLKIIPLWLKKFLNETTVNYTTNVSGYYTGQGKVSQKPVVIHPLTGEETMFIALNNVNDDNPNYSSYFADLSKEQSDSYMLEIDKYYRKEECLYEHIWDEGDILILDNFYVSHGRNKFDSKDSRRLLRISLEI